MSLWKRNSWYWADFTVNGTRYRVPLETKDAREAKGREKDKIADARDGKLASSAVNFARLGFEAALDKYLAELAVTREDKTKTPRKTWEGRLTERLRPYFAGKRLNQITADHIREFQSKRLQAGVHANTCNHEVKALLRLLKRAKLASRIRDDVKLLRVRKEARQMLAQAEKQRLFEIASSKPEWETAYCAALLTANTTARPVELRRLKWQDLDPVNRLVIIRRSKTDAGARVIPVNDEAWSAFAALKKRADAIGTYAPEHYIFHRMWPVMDPGRPMSGWRSAWRNLTRSVACPGCAQLQPQGDACRNPECKADMRGLKSPFAKFRYYDLRHQAVTEMLESGIPEGVIREVAGHIDPAMTRHYSHPRLAARRAAVEAIASVKTSSEGESEGGYVTNHVTKALPAPSRESEVIEGNGTPGGIRTPDLLLRRQPLYPSELQAHLN
jgi:integrase